MSGSCGGLVNGGRHTAPLVRLDADAEVGAHDLGVAHDHLWQPLGDELAVVQDRNTVGQGHHGAHDVLDKDDRGALVTDR